MPLAKGTKMAFKPLIQPNAVCPDCPPVPSHRNSRSSNELTAQCTDQCVVIACTDPNHAESVCNGGGPNSHCEAVCEEIADCSDCHGFDALLQCCEDYHPYNEDSSRSLFQNTGGSDISWTGAFDDLWCSCNPPSTTSPPKAEPCAQRGSDAFLAKVPPWHRNNDSFLHNDFLPSAQPPPKNLSLSSCLWNSCQGSFPSMSELVGHVGSHLLESLPPSSNNTESSIPYQSESATSMSCLWGDCNSSYSSWPNDFELLAQHLMNDHLGITVPSSYSQRFPGLSNELMVSPVPSHDLKHQSNGFDPQLPITNPPRSSGSGSSTPITKSDTSSESIECRWKDCGKCFHTCDDLTSHINSDHIGGGKARYECFWDGCHRNGNQGFQSKQKISRHVQSHTGHRPFQCNICHQNFSEAATLQQHIRRHTQEKPYVCDFPGCGKSFAITGALTIHKRTHNGDKPFKCTYCDRGFAESSNLSKHLRTHTGARPYTCLEPGCNKSFARPDQLNRHKAVHKKQIRGIALPALQ